jgi:phage/conjugal plasmid C-4 type zinc finger TraR family protein
MDEMDQAQGYNEDFQQFVLQQQRLGREPANYTGSGCLDCGEEIPVERRHAMPGCRRCIECQTTL